MKIAVNIMPESLSKETQVTCRAHLFTYFATVYEN